jgi:IS5 family transposase
MQLFNELVLKFERPDWSKNPEFGLIDTIFEMHPELYSIVAEDITSGEKMSNFGRKDVPSVEQIVRAAIYKEMKGLDYRELEYAQSDSRICETFIKLDQRKPYSFQLFQKYISRISVTSLTKLLYSINRIAINAGYEDVAQIRQDSTMVESNIHYPTNNSLVWDCIRESDRLMRHLKEEMDDLSYIDYTKSAKSTFFKINNTKLADKRADLFRKQLATFTKTINQTSNAIKKKSVSIAAFIIQHELDRLLLLMEQVYQMTYRREINNEAVPNNEKIFSIYELHTDIIVKGSREVQFGHKINLTSGKSNLILDCEVLRGNPSDRTLYQPTLSRVIEGYRTVPRDTVTDGGYASLENLWYAQRRGIANVVFNKVTGSLRSMASSLNMETRLKKWRSGIEANISNLKRGFNLSRCTWKGWEHFQSKVLWSVLGYNFRVLTTLTLAMIAKLV